LSRVHCLLPCRRHAAPPDRRTLPPRQVHPAAAPRQDMNHINSNTSEVWGSRFLVDLKSMKRKQEEHWMAVGFGFASFRMVGMGMDFKALDTQQALISYRQKAHRVILLDWGGTLSPADMGFYDQRDTDKYQLPESTLAVLRALCADANNHVMILSGLGRDKVLYARALMFELSDGGCAPDRSSLTPITNHPTTQPPNLPTSQPPNHPTTQPPNHPTTQPPNHPTTQPLNHSTTQPPSTTTPTIFSFPLARCAILVCVCDSPDGLHDRRTNGRQGSIFQDHRRPSYRIVRPRPPAYGLLSGLFRMCKSEQETLSAPMYM